MLGAYKAKEAAVEFFNKTMCELLIGGVLCEAIDQRDVVVGVLNEKRSIWPVDFGQSASSHLHSKLRMRLAGTIDVITLSKPKSISLSQFRSSLVIGQNCLKKIPNFIPSFLIRGITEIRYKNWALALSSLWISVEQLTDFLWTNELLADPQRHPKAHLGGRIDALRSDVRTWTIAVKHEVLFQLKVLDEPLFLKLYAGRQARNKLVHEGSQVKEDTVFGLYDAILKLLTFCSQTSTLPIENLNLREKRTASHSIVVLDDFDDWESLSKKA